MIRHTARLTFELSPDMSISIGLIRETIMRMSGVTRTFVNPAVEAAWVQYDAEQCSAVEIIEALEARGVRANLVSVQRSSDSLITS